MKFRRIKAIAGTSFVMAAGAAGAQNAEQHNSKIDALEEIIVTAQRKEERLQDVPISIALFDQEQITQRNIITAGDLSTYTPSLATNNRFGGETTTFAIRGFTQEIQTSPSVAVYFADVPAPRAQGGTTGGNGAGVGAFFDLQNVQVLRGPQGTLFGRNTTGGAVLLVPKKPTAESEGYVSASLGDYDYRRLQGVINQPLTDNLRIRVGVDSNSRQGYLNNVSGIGPDDFADVDYNALRISLVANITPALENYTIFAYSDSDSNGYLPKIINQDNIERDPFPDLRAAQIASTSGDFYDVANGLPNAHQQIEQLQLINTTSWDVSENTTLKNIFSYSRFEQAQASMIYGENGYQNGTTLPVYAIAISPEPGKNNVAQQTYTEELQLLGNSADGKFTYQLGAYYEVSKPLDGFQSSYSPASLACMDVDNLQCTDVLGVGFLSNSKSEYDFLNRGIYAQGNYALTDRLNLTVGLRNTWDRSEGLGESLKISFPSPNTPAYGCVQPVPLVQGGTSEEVESDPSRCSFKREVSSSEPTWMVNLDYRPGDNSMVYAKYARGYRQGGINVTSYGLETWDPEKVDLYELGMKTSWVAAVPGSFNFSVFYNDFTDQQIAINTVSCLNIPSFALPFFPACDGIPPSEFPAPAQGIGNSGESTIQGVELDSTLFLTDNFKIQIAYAYLDTELKSIDLPPVDRGFAFYAPNAVVGGPMAITPRNKYTITASYDLPISDELGLLTLSGTYTYQDEMFGNASSIVATGSSSQDSDGEDLPSQKQLNINLGWKSILGSTFDLAMFVTNVTNEEYVTYTSGASFGWDAAMLNPPRMYGASLSYNF